MQIIFFSSSNNFFLKNSFKVALQYFFNVFILFNIVSNLKLNFKLKMDPKMCTFKNLEKNQKNRVATLLNQFLYYLECYKVTKIIWYFIKSKNTLELFIQENLLNVATSLLTYKIFYFHQLMFIKVYTSELHILLLFNF